MDNVSPNRHKNAPHAQAAVGLGHIDGNDHWCAPHLIQVVQNAHEGLIIHASRQPTWTVHIRSNIRLFDQGEHTGATSSWQIKLEVGTDAIVPKDMAPARDTLVTPGDRSNKNETGCVCWDTCPCEQHARRTKSQVQRPWRQQPRKETRDNTGPCGPNEDRRHRRTGGTTRSGQGRETDGQTNEAGWVWYQARQVRPTRRAKYPRTVRRPASTEQGIQNKVRDYTVTGGTIRKARKTCAMGEATGDIGNNEMHSNK